VVEVGLGHVDVGQSKGQSHMFISTYRERTHGSRERATTQKTWLHGVLLLISEASTCASLTPASNDPGVVLSGTLAIQ